MKKCGVLFTLHICLEMKYWKIAFGACIAIPIATMALISIFYFHAWSVLGRVPTYSNPDPKQMDLFTYYGPFADTGLILTVGSFLLWILLAILYPLIKRKQRNWKLVISSGLVQALTFIFVASDIFEWYID